MLMSNSTQSTGINWWEDGDVSNTWEDDDVTNFSAGKVSLKGEFLNHDILKLSAKISDMETPVLGVAFHLVYNSDELYFLRYDPGNFLERGGSPFYLVMPERDQAGSEFGKVIYGATLRRNDDFPVGEGTVADFYFQQLNLSSETYEFGFKNGVVSTLDVVRQNIANVKFEDLVLARNSEEESVQPAVLDSGISASVGFPSWVMPVVFGTAICFSAIAFVFFKMKKRRKFANSFAGV